ncbi:MAG TPA: Xaa-Pro peptidase family protein [Candidatus Sulfotelmatobacter sp.]|nr:Xaa-Pro peptidase family protein [Candidatus Sulfotelmatobacter sp.]
MNPEPTVDDLAALTPPSAAQRERWAAGDRAARPARLARLRERMVEARVDAYFGVRSENSRYLTGFALGDGEDRVAGNSGQFLVLPDEVALLADSRYTEQAGDEAPDARIVPVYHDLAERWPDLVRGCRRVAVEGAHVSRLTWDRLAGAVPDVELVPVEGWVEAQRATKEPSEVERIAAACAVADAALARLVPAIQVGMTEAQVALDLEWGMRTHGADALAFDVAVLAGPQAALPHGSPGARRIQAGQVLLFDFGAQVAGYRSDMTRTLFVGEPSSADLALYRLVAAAQQAAIDFVAQAAAAGRRPVAREADTAARRVIEAAGHGGHFGHGLGHGIGLATHESPSLGRQAASDAPLPGPTVFSVEPGVYLEGRTGVRIEDLVLFDPDDHRLERLTRFPREITIIAA